MIRAPHAIERDLRRSAQAFDVPALLDVLALLGHREPDVVFGGELGAPSRGNVVEAVAFTAGDAFTASAAQVTTNLGLLGPQSPLPSFFLEALETLQVPTLLDLIRVLDHQALALRFASLYPERDPRLAGGTAWEPAKRRVTHTLGLASPSSLHWLFTLVFPELAVIVRRGGVHRRVAAPDARLGTLRLAVAALGGDAVVPTGGLDVLLDADDVPPPGPSWMAEAARRMRDQIVPTLTGVELDLTVRLRLCDVPHHLRIAIDPIGDATLGGADQLDDRPGDHDATTERLLLVCSGAISDLHFPPL
jgi:hypothetical protein